MMRGSSFWERHARCIRREPGNARYLIDALPAKLTVGRAGIRITRLPEDAEHAAPGLAGGIPDA